MVKKREVYRAKESESFIDRYADRMADRQAEIEDKILDGIDEARDKFRSDLRATKVVRQPDGSILRGFISLRPHLVATRGGVTVWLHRSPQAKGGRMRVR